MKRAQNAKYGLPKVRGSKALNTLVVTSLLHSKLEKDIERVTIKKDSISANVLTKTCLPIEVILNNLLAVRSRINDVNDLLKP